MSGIGATYAGNSRSATMNVHQEQLRSGIGVRVLVVDDSSTMRRLMDLTLRPLGVDLEFSARGDEAIMLALKNHYDVILLDVMLPGVDGYQVCKAIKRDPRAKHVPDKVKGIMAGTNVYLTKPIKRSMLIAALDQNVPGLLTAGAWWIARQAASHHRTEAPAVPSKQSSSSNVQPKLSTNQETYS
jgi:CheY-like chemotaxis protein